jgi:hypothetical protein
MAASAGVAAAGGVDPQQMSDGKGRHSAGLQRLKSEVDEMSSRCVGLLLTAARHRKHTQVYVHAQHHSIGMSPCNSIHIPTGLCLNAPNTQKRMHAPSLVFRSPRIRHFPAVAAHLHACTPAVLHTHVGHAMHADTRVHAWVYCYVAALHTTRYEHLDRRLDSLETTLLTLLRNVKSRVRNPAAGAGVGPAGQGDSVAGTTGSCMPRMQIA